MTELAKQYQAQEAQARWFQFWEENGFFNADPNPNKKPHTIMIPLPNVTGALHMGHALNGTLQDLITRLRRMQGYEALWMPGTDHAGIATQAVVERRMHEEEGLTRHDVGREELVRRIWKWKDNYEARILSQLKSIGASCDWRRVRFTLDDVCSKAVRRTFFKFFKDGLIFRGKRLVNWDTFLQTAVADDEVYHEEVDGHFWTFRYPVVAESMGQMGPTGQISSAPAASMSPTSPVSPIPLTGEFIEFSTTRPETMLGDTAVCVHPTDERYQHLIGKHVQIPLTGRLIPIIADALLAKKDLGTGCVKVTPAHDPNDYQCGLRNNLPMINILNPDGTLNENGDKYQGLDRYEARKKVVEDMGSLGHFLKVEDRKIELAHSDRSKTPVEPYLSAQWFVKMSDHDDGKPGLAQTAMNAVTEKRVRFFPSRYTSTYMDWLGEKRDWCISRQLWWGHRIPVWTGMLNVGGSFSTPDEAKAEEARTQAVRENAYAQLSEYLTKAGVSADEYVIKLSDDSIQCCAGSERADAALRAFEQFKNSFKLTKSQPGHEYPEPLREVPGFEGAKDAAFAAHDFFELHQDSDVLDTWFSSALWPHATLGWPDLDHNPPMTGAEAPAGQNQVLPYFYPGNVLITSRDIITLWVARMVLTGLYNMGDVPFHHVHVHPKILDGFGQTMSKSKGNGCDPLDLIARYGCDAVRFTIASFAGETQDVRLPMAYECPHCQTLVPQALDDDGVMVKPQTLKTTLRGSAGKVRMPCPNPKCKQESQFSTPYYEPDAGEPIAKMVSERFEYGRNFCNKFWNAARFAIMNLEGYTPAPVAEADLRLEDQWILSRLTKTINEVTTLLDRYQFDQATRALRDFTWNEFCDWYLEMIKPRLRSEEHRAVAQRVLVGVLDMLVRSLQPFTPFICEELWQRLNEIASTRGLLVKSETPGSLQPEQATRSVMIAPWPHLPSAWQNEQLESRFNRLQETVVAVRNIRAVYNIAPAQPIKLHLKCADTVASELNACADQFDNLAKAVLAAAGAEVERPAASASFNVNDADGYVPLEGLIDVKAELDRQTKEAEKIRNFIRGHESKLSNESFVARAPEQVVAQARDTLASLKKQLESVELVILQLSGK